MRARITVSSVIASLVLAGAVVSIAASPAFAASCGNGQGQALLIGCNNNTATDDTHLSSPATNSAVLFLTATGSGTTTGLSASGSATGVYGAGDKGVFGQGGSIGVSGTGFTGVAGFGGSGPAGTGVSGSGETGVSGSGVIGVKGTTGLNFGTGVFGDNDGGGNGVHGHATSGIGVLADSANGTALRVSGRSKFSTAGTAVVTSGHKSVTVALPGVSATDFVLATAQGAGAFFVKNASAGSGQFTIYLNKLAPPAGVKVAYFVISSS